jgi:hypothetical protein
VLEVGGDLDLPQEALAAEHGGQLRVEDLDGDLAAVPDVLGEVDGRHAALTQLAPDAVAIGERRREPGGGCRHARSPSTGEPAMVRG